MIWPFRRRRFRDVVRRQLALFATEHDDVVQGARTALRDYHAAPEPSEAQERYAEYDDLAEDVETLLYEMCERLAASMEEDARPEYVREFDRQARSTYGDLLPRLNFPEPDILDPE